MNVNKITKEEETKGDFIFIFLDNKYWVIVYENR